MEKLQITFGERNLHQEVLYMFIGLPTINDAPVYGESSNEYVADYYDKIISCSSDVPEEHKEYINHQIHRYSKYCHVGKLKHCRFSFPQPPMAYTCILEPFSAEDIEKKMKENNHGHVFITILKVMD